MTKIGAVSSYGGGGEANWAGFAEKIFGLPHCEFASGTRREEFDRRVSDPGQATRRFPFLYEPLQQAVLARPAGLAAGIGPSIALLTREIRETSQGGRLEGHHSGRGQRHSALYDDDDGVEAMLPVYDKPMIY